MVGQRVHVAVGCQQRGAGLSRRVPLVVDGVQKLARPVPAADAVDFVNRQQPVAGVPLPHLCLAAVLRRAVVVVEGGRGLRHDVAGAHVAGGDAEATGGGHGRLQQPRLAHAIVPVEGQEAAHVRQLRQQPMSGAVGAPLPPTSAQVLDVPVVLLRQQPGLLKSLRPAATGGARDGFRVRTEPAHVGHVGRAAQVQGRVEGAVVGHLDEQPPAAAAVPAVACRCRRVQPGAAASVFQSPQVVQHGGVDLYGCARKRHHVRILTVTPFCPLASPHLAAGIFVSSPMGRERCPTRPPHPSRVAARPVEVAPFLSSPLCRCH